MYILRGKAFPSRALRCALPLPAGTPRNAPSALRILSALKKISEKLRNQNFSSIYITGVFHAETQSPIQRFRFR